MNARRTPFLTRLALGLALVLVTWCVSCAPAEARDSEGRQGKSAVAQLKPAELEVLRRKFPNWDQLDRGKQERIARGVIRLRTLSAEERARLQARVGELKERGKRAEWMRFAQGAGESVWQQLPEACRRELGKRRVRPAMAKMVLFHKVKGRIAASEGSAFQPTDVQAFPERWRERAARAAAVLADQSAGEKEKQRARYRLGDLRAQLKIEALKSRLVAEARNGPVPVEQVVAALRRTWPDAFDAVAQEVGAQPERFAEMLERQGQRGPRDGGRPGRPLSPADLAQLVMQLERAARQNWRTRAELQAAADAVIRRVLVQDFKADATTVRALPGYDRPKEREQALRRLLPRLFKRDGVRSGMRGPRDGGGRRRPGGGRPAGPKDEDK